MSNTGTEAGGAGGGRLPLVPGVLLSKSTESAIDSWSASAEKNRFNNPLAFWAADLVCVPRPRVVAGASGAAVSGSAGTAAAG